MLVPCQRKRIEVGLCMWSGVLLGRYQHLLLPMPEKNWRVAFLLCVGAILSHSICFSRSWLFKDRYVSLQYKLGFMKPSPVVCHDTISAKTSYKNAYVIAVFSGTKYLCGAAMIAWTLRDRNRTEIDLVAIVAGRLSQQEEREHDNAVRYLKELGYIIKSSPPLANPFQHKNNENSNLYSKVNMWSLTEYKKALFVDTDVMFPNGARRIDKLFSYYDGGLKPVGFIHRGRKRKGQTKSGVNSGLLLYQPNTTIYLDMLAKISSVKSDDGSDQGFINAYFNDFHVGFEGFKKKHFHVGYSLKKRTNLTVFTRLDPKHFNYDAYHHFGVKVWQCPRGKYCSYQKAVFSRYTWPQLNDLFWDYFDKMATAWPFVLDKKYKSFCVADKPMSSRIHFSVSREEIWNGIETCRKQTNASEYNRAGHRHDLLLRIGCTQKVT